MFDFLFVRILRLTLKMKIASNCDLRKSDESANFGASSERNKNQKPHREYIRHITKDLIREIL